VRAAWRIKNTLGFGSVRYSPRNSVISSREKRIFRFPPVLYQSWHPVIPRDA
jgi:hypothetical protein